MENDKFGDIYKNLFFDYSKEKLDEFKKTPEYIETLKHFIINRVNGYLYSNLKDLKYFVLQKKKLKVLNIFNDYQEKLKYLNEIGKLIDEDSKFLNFIISILDEFNSNKSIEKLIDVLIDFEDYRENMKNLYELKLKSISEISSFIIADYNLKSFEKDIYKLIPTCEEEITYDEEDYSLNIELFDNENNILVYDNKYDELVDKSKALKAYFKYKLNELIDARETSINLVRDSFDEVDDKSVLKDLLYILKKLKWLTNSLNKYIKNNELFIENEANKLNFICVSVIDALNKYPDLIIYNLKAEYPDLAVYKEEEFLEILKEVTNFLGEITCAEYFEEKENIINVTIKEKNGGISKIRT